MSKTREHIVIEPTGDSVDFQRKDYDTTRVWFQHPRPAWVATLLPAAISAACSGSDFTFSSWRKFPLRSPAEFTIPSNEGAFLIRAFMPIGGNFDPTLWTCLSYFDARRPPVVSSERFHLGGNSLKRLLTDLLAAPEQVDKLRRLDRRPRTECWVRHDWRVVDLAEIDKPRWMDEVAGLSPADASARMLALRAPMSGAEYLRLRKQQREERECQQAAEGEASIDVASEAEDFAAKAVALDQITRAAEAPAQEPAPQACLTREQLIEARKTKAKLAKATRSKVAADKANAAAAKRHADKAIARLEREGRL